MAGYLSAFIVRTAPTGFWLPGEGRPLALPSRSAGAGYRVDAAGKSAVRPAWITGCKRPPRPLLGVVLLPFEVVHVVTQQDE